MKSKVHRGLVIAYSPSGVSHVIAQSIVRAPDHDREDILERFVEMKQRELATVLLSCALVASLIASLMSWDWFPVPAVTARIAALCALIHSVVAVGIAAQQLIALTRAHIHPDRAKIMQYILFGEAIPSIPTAGLDVSLTSQATAINTGSVWRHFSWQIPTMMLGNSLVFTLIALAIAIFDEARKSVVWQTPEMVTAICVAVSLAFSVCCYFISWFCIEWQMQEAIAKDLQSQTSPRQAGTTVDSMV
ncbi:hypothetical protein C7974DRAFT_404857 [Boeremia exigua]|uniref:uncharacterized protein n=1 Tax=Boeremia exigua TaxID=749465 RepID=UPI001E8DCC5F|nr:uncharacterized protein C7974DRAFT_404857 [Boeremia exigua]KAH6614306.1 hypothetical protein C7974DRAFT_404857 [Boeremia exigua]